MLHWRDIKKALPATTILQHRQISSQCHMTFFPKYGCNRGTYLDWNLQQNIFKFISKELVLLHVFPSDTTARRTEQDIIFIVKTEYLDWINPHALQLCRNLLHIHHSLFIYTPRSTLKDNDPWQLNHNSDMPWSDCFFFIYLCASNYNDWYGCPCFLLNFKQSEQLHLTYSIIYM